MMRRRTIFIGLIGVILLIALIFILIPKDQKPTPATKDVFYTLIDKDGFEPDNGSRTINIVGDIKDFEQGWYVAKFEIKQIDDHRDEDTDEEVYETVSAIGVIYSHEKYEPELVISPFDYYFIEDIKRLVAPAAIDYVLQSRVDTIIYEDTNE